MKGYWSPLNPKAYRSLIGALEGTLIDPFRDIGVSGKPKYTKCPMYCYGGYFPKS